jgi:hypothetical protein
VAYLDFLAPCLASVQSHLSPDSLLNKIPLTSLSLLRNDRKSYKSYKLLTLIKY